MDRQIQADSKSKVALDDITLWANRCTKYEVSRKYHFTFPFDSALCKCKILTLTRCGYLPELGCSVSYRTGVNLRSQKFRGTGSPPLQFRGMLDRKHASFLGGLLCRVWSLWVKRYEYTRVYFFNTLCEYTYGDSSLMNCAPRVRPCKVTQGHRSLTQIDRVPMTRSNYGPTSNFFLR